MVSGSRACLTFILSDHPHWPSRHFDGALGPLVTLVLALTGENELSMGLVVRRWTQCSAG
jgi:hypothetical protein